MNALPIPIGRRGDGREVHGWRFGSDDGLQAEVWSQGALLRSLTVPLPGGRRVEVLQTPPDLAAVEADGDHHGVVIGPVANRIGGARFTLEGREHRLAPDLGRHLLHSGAAGWDRKPWRFGSLSAQGCELQLETPAGDGGFPGGVRAEVAFAVERATLRIEWRAAVDAPTPIAPTQHLYFDLSGGDDPDILTHAFRVDAPFWTPTDVDLIPTGEIAPTAGGPLDVSRWRPLRELAGGALDHNLVLAPGGRVELRAPSTGVRLELRTDQPALQVYTGEHLKAPFRPFSAVALEPQAFPDAVNRPEFPSVIVRPGEPFRRWAAYSFEVGA